jgi:PAS domain S-box-containing protein
MLGYTESELRERTFASLTHPDDLPLNLKLRDELLAGQRDSFVLEKRYLKKDGDIVWTRHSAAAAHGAEGISTLIVIAEDITKRKLAEIGLTRVNRLHKVLSAIGEAIIRLPNRQELYEAACRILVEYGQLRMAYVAEVDARARLARPVASFGIGQTYLDEATSIIPTDDGPLSMGTVGTALRTGVHDVCNDIAGARRMRPWQRSALKHGLLAAASFPLRQNGTIVAILVLYAGERGYFQQDEIALMVTIADNLSFALDALAKDQQRQRAEARLAELAAIVDSSDDAIVGKDLNGVITSWNKGAEKMLGYTAEEVVGKSSFQIIPADQADEESRILEQILRGESVQNFETVRQTKRGDKFNISITASPIRNAAGDLVGVSTVGRDITRTKISEARFRRLVESNAQGVFFWTVKGDIIGANDAFLNLTGYTRDDLKSGRINWMAITPPEYSDRDRHALDQCAAAGVCTPYEKEYVRKDGSRVPILLGAAMFEDNPAEGFCFVIDLTEHKKLEHQLRQSQKMEGIGALAGGVAHDFNNLLAVIQMQAELLKMGDKVSDDHSAFANDILASVERASSLTRQLLLFSSREVFQPRDLDLSESISDTIKMLKRLVGEHIQVQLKIAPQPMFLHADPGMMDQIVLNLLVNARDAMPNGGQIIIETSGVEFDEFAASQSAQTRVGSFVCLSVSDNGCGIPADILPKIFEPFFTTKDVGKGTGLGLSTVFGIVRQHQGWINVYSEVGHGTTFRIYLPRLARNATMKSSPQAPIAARGGSETILLVEDNASLRAVVQTALSRLGYRVLEAPTGVKALTVWEENQSEIRLLLTDLVMPDGMTGVALAQRILQDNPKLKIIYMSGYSAEVVSKDLPIKEGVNFLTKPFQAHKLAQTVRNCLDKD